MYEKSKKLEHFNNIAETRDAWKKRNAYYHNGIEHLISTFIPKDSTVLEIGCGTGDLISNLKPRYGAGIDFSTAMISKAMEKYPKSEYPNLDFFTDDAEDLQIKGTFDYIIMSDILGDLYNVWNAFRSIKKVSHGGSRIIITSTNTMWEPILRLGARLKLNISQDYQNWLTMSDIENLLSLHGFEVVRKDYSILIPKKIPVLSAFFNRVLAPLPLIRKLCLVNCLIAKPVAVGKDTEKKSSVSIIIPCRNERGNIRSAVTRTPFMGSHTEIIFVDGNSNDGTVEEIEQVITEFKDKKDIKLVHQLPRGSKDGEGHGKMLKLGKGDAVRKGFEAASGDILMILDADLTVPPETLPMFYQALVEGRGEFINGCRLVYPMEKEAMRFLNKLGNMFFSLLFTWLLGQPIKDTLCGTKVLFRRDYEKISLTREYFGDFDPFGDFDLLFGASKNNLKIVEVPVRYRERTYGDIKIRRFKHGLLLIKMSILAMIKLKFI